VRVLVLGSTGSIGTQTLDVIDHLHALGERGEGARRYEIVGLAGGHNTDLLAEQASRHGVSSVVSAGDDDEGLPGSAAAGQVERLARDESTRPDVVVAAIVGAAGIRSTLAAAELGLDLALANKESLVAAGELVVGACRASGARLLPVDSEHAALWHAALSFAGPGYAPPAPLASNIRRLVLTASGGPFRDAAAWPAPRLASVTPEEALAHPTWDMGPKVTVDCASLTNKAMELIEAHWLYGLPEDRLDVLVHPQSTLHSMVEGVDGSFIAQLGPTDMRAPIQQALTFPDRVEPASGRMALDTLTGLDFHAPDESRFGAIALARRVMRAGGSAGAVVNGANEEAVGAFLDGRLPFDRITALASEALDGLGTHPLHSLEDVWRADEAARAFVRERVQPAGAGPAR